MQRFLIALFLVLAALPAYAAQPAQGQYLDVGNFPLQILAAPPAEGSPKWKQAIKDVTNAQRLITADDLTAIRREVRLNPADFAAMAGIHTPPLTTGLLNRVADDVHGITSNAKRYWNTRRPYVADKRVKLQVPALANNSYPSGHSSFAYTLAGVLGQLYPDKQTVLQEKAKDMSWRRVQAGVHYPVDLEGGKTLAVAILGALNQNATYRADLRAAQEEIAGRLQVPVAAATPQPVAAQPVQAARAAPSAPASPVAQAVQAQLAQSMDNTQQIVAATRTTEQPYYYAGVNQQPQQQAQQPAQPQVLAQPAAPSQTYEVPYQRTVQQYPTVSPQSVQLARQPDTRPAQPALRDPPPFPEDFWLKSRSLYFAE